MHQSLFPATTQKKFENLKRKLQSFAMKTSH